MNPVRIVNVRRRATLGAEELIELGQVRTPVAEAVPPPLRAVTLSREEGQLLVKVVENIIAFSKEYPIEFQSYCPPDRWQKALQQVGGWSHEIQSQLAAGKTTVTVPSEAVLRLVDLERCITSARDARLSSARLSFLISAGAALGGTLLGLGWLTVPAYVAGLVILLGRPLVVKYTAEPEEPYRPMLSGDCEAHADMGDHTDKAKVLERVVLSRSPHTRVHHWGTVEVVPGPLEAGVCLAKEKHRVRVEGWRGDVVRPAPGWEKISVRECMARNVIGVWEACGADPRVTAFGPIPARSGHEETYWIEYVGPLTGGVCRRAGPFG